MITAGGRVKVLSRGSGVLWVNLETPSSWKQPLAQSLHATAIKGRGSVSQTQGPESPRGGYSL